MAADPAGGANIKKGVGYTGGGHDAVMEMGVSWVRTWGIHAVGWEDVQFFPTVYRPSLVGDVVPQPYLEELAGEAAVNPGTCWIVWNEPDLKGPGSATLPVREAVIIWPQVRDAIMSTDPTACFIFGNVVWESYQGYSGKTWLEEFMAEYQGDLLSEIDAWGLHLYAEMLVEPWQWWAACPPDATSVSHDEMTIRYLASLERALAWSNQTGGGLPIYFTEWGQLRDLCQGFTCAECKTGLECDYRKTLMRRVMPWFDREPMIAGYAWFATRTDSCPQDWCPCCESDLVTGDGTDLTMLGGIYARPYRQFLMPISRDFESPLH